MALQHICLISCYHNYFRNPGLPEIIDHSLGNGNGSKLKAGFKVSHRDDFPAATIKAPVCMIVTSLKALYKIDTIIS